MILDRFNNPPVGADFKLVAGGTIWEPVEDSGYFSHCDRCGLELEGFPVRFWALNIGPRKHRYFCLDCGDFLKQVDNATPTPRATP